MNHLIRPRTSLTLLAVLAIGFTACDDPVTPPPPPTGITVPETYTFKSRFDSTKSSVDYGGQVVRNLLIQDLQTMLGSIGKPGAVPVTEAELLALYEHSDAANLATSVSVPGRELLERQYNRISTGKKLSDKVSPDQVISMNMTADQLIRGWLRTAAANSQDPTKLGTTAAIYDENGLDLPEMVGKTLLGALAYYQATSVYLGNVLSKDNAVAADDGKGGKLAYTVMEHNWDEAFGYYGAARDYARYSDLLLTGPATDYTYDSNGDGKIDLRSEYNFTIARYAARRDRAVAGTDFTKTIFDAFRIGRTAITNQGTNDQIGAQRAIAAAAWEKVMAASFIHYLNGSIAAVDKMGTSEFNIDSYRHEWSEMKGFAIALQFNSSKSITDAQLAQLHALIGNVPVTADPSTPDHGAYAAALASARSLIKGVYGFTDAQVNAW